jgi:hypothetical protein
VWGADSALEVAPRLVLFAGPQSRVVDDQCGRFSAAGMDFGFTPAITEGYQSDGRQICGVRLVVGETQPVRSRVLDTFVLGKRLLR